MAVSRYLPHIDILLRGMRTSPERLQGNAKIAVDASVLRALIRTCIATQPFDAEFYLSTYPDIAAAHAAGNITDLHGHYVERGWTEGRFGAPPAVDEQFYVMTYPDVARALRDGEIPSARDHYVRAGAAEGRIPSPVQGPEIEAWMTLLGVQAG